MLRITLIPADGGIQTLKVEGRLTLEFVNELSRAVRGALDRSPGVTLDLADVSYVDQSGAELLRSFRSGGVELGRMSTFVSSLIDGGLV